MTRRAPAPPLPGGETGIDTDALIAEYEAEKPARTLAGAPLLIVQAIAVGLSLFALYRTFTTIPAQL